LSYVYTRNELQASDNTREHKQITTNQTAEILTV